MLRDKNLIPLSQQHQHALALCVQLDRELKEDATAAVEHWQEQVQQQFAREIRFHFEAEEAILFPEASRFSELKPIVQDLLVEHRILRMYARKAAERKLGREGLVGFAETLSNHVRKEERELFEGCQRLMTKEELQNIGQRTDDYFRSVGMSEDR